MRVRGYVSPLLRGGALLVLALCPAEARAQVLPEAPISIAGGHLVLGAEVSATFAPEDPGFFNYTSYEYSALRNLRLALSAEVRANDHVQLLTEVRLDQGRLLDAYGLFVRLRPWPARRFDLQVGRIPPTFGAMTRAAYGSGNILIGQPLAYHYLLSIRPDALPATSDDLLRMRGRGWLSNFPVGNTAPAPGLPIVSTSDWDTGVQAHGVNGKFEWTGAVTAGSLSDPRVRDNNSGRQIAGRLIARPHAALAFGASASRGAWLNRNVDAEAAGLESGKRSQQVAFGGDAEYSAGRILIRGEAIRSRWALPGINTLQLAEPLVATSMLVEGRVKIAPGFYVASRGERLDFSWITGAQGPNTWEARTWRIETGLGYSLTRNIQVKASWQRNDRTGGRVRRDSLAAAQVLYWF
jgi:hypothetical protein